jgi:hypothetical protein
MSTSRYRTLTRHCLIWLCWLALLLPIAQSVALWHGFSHATATSSSPDRDEHGAHAGHCNLCLSAASVLGGVLLGDLTCLSQEAARFSLPQAALGSVWLAPAYTAYLSRAPPLPPV